MGVDVSSPQVVSLSGGKDSTAMLLMLLERGDDIHSVVFFDGGWDFPQMHDHMERLESYTGLEIVRLYPKYGFTERMLRTPVHTRAGELRFSGRGWPSSLRRWCTREKSDRIDKYVRGVKGVSCIGYAADEAWRTQTKKIQTKPTRFPLIEWGVTEAEALAYCKQRGFDWGGLYDHFARVSCFCCPLQRIGALRTLRRNFPGLWAEMLEIESLTTDELHRRFKGELSVSDLNARFAEEDRQCVLPCMEVAP